MGEERTDQVLTCADCSEEFVFSVKDQEYFEKRKFKSPPKRCKKCSKARRQRTRRPDSGRRKGAGRGPAQGNRSARQRSNRGNRQSRRPADRGNQGDDDIYRSPAFQNEGPSDEEIYRAPAFQDRVEGADEYRAPGFQDLPDSIGNRRVAPPVIDRNHDLESGPPPNYRETTIYRAPAFADAPKPPHPHSRSKRGRGRKGGPKRRR
jgi:hypothetical protein